MTGNKDINTLSEEELTGKIYNEISSDRTSTSYDILAKLVEQGWKYNEDKFNRILSKLKHIQGTIKLNDVDGYLKAEPIQLDALLMDLTHRSSCFGCCFRQDVRSNYYLSKLYFASRGMQDRDIKDYCALNHTIRVSSTRENAPESCPVNKALERLKKKD